MSIIEAERPAANILADRMQAILAAKGNRMDAFALPDDETRLASAGAVAGMAGQAVPAGLVRDAVMGLKLGASLSGQVFAVGGSAFVAIAAQLFFPRGTADHDDILAATRLMTQLARAYPGALVPELNEQGVVTGLRNKDGTPVMWLDGSRGLQIDESRFPDLPAISREPLPPRRLDTVSSNVTANVHGAPWINQAGEPPYRSEAREVARAHNRTARQDDLLIPVPVLEAGESAGPVIGYLRGDAGAITEQVGAMKHSGRMPEDFDLASMARSVGINWDGAIRQFANRRAFRLAAENPITLSGSTAGVYPDREEAVGAARAANAYAQPGSPYTMYVPIELDVTSAHFSERGLTHQVYSGSIDKLEDFYETMREQGRLPPGVSFRELLGMSGIPTRESRSVTSAGGDRLDDPQGLSGEEQRELGLNGPTPDLPAQPPAQEAFPRGGEEDPGAGIFQNPGVQDLHLPTHTGDDGTARREAEALLNDPGFLSQNNGRPRPILRPAPQTPPAPLARPVAAPAAPANAPSITPLTPEEIDHVATHLSQGHAHNKHRHEFAEIGINTRQELYDHFADILTRQPESKLLGNGRAAIYDAVSNTIIFLDDATRYAITAFRPARGRAYYDNKR